jgi:hypothetical protein
VKRTGTEVEAIACITSSIWILSESVVEKGDFVVVGLTDDESSDTMHDQTRIEHHKQVVCVPEQLEIRPSTPTRATGGVRMTQHVEVRIRAALPDLLRGCGNDENLWHHNQHASPARPDCVQHMLGCLSSFQKPKWQSDGQKCPWGVRRHESAEAKEKYEHHWD